MVYCKEKLEKLCRKNMKKYRIYIFLSDKLKKTSATFYVFALYYMARGGTKATTKTMSRQMTTTTYGKQRKIGFLILGKI